MRGRIWWGARCVIRQPSIQIFWEIFTNTRYCQYIRMAIGSLLNREAAQRGIETCMAVIGWDNPSSYRLPGAPMQWANCWSQIQKRNWRKGLIGIKIGWISAEFPPMMDISKRNGSFHGKRIFKCINWIWIGNWYLLLAVLLPSPQTFRILKH